MKSRSVAPGALTGAPNLPSVSCGMPTREVALEAGRPERLASIDVVRGAVMVLMAIDHVRVYAGIPAGGPTPGLFFTRWVTHFCAPVFVFLAGTSAWMYSRRHPNLARFLVTRGIWLVVLELTVIRAAWTFNLDVQHLLAGVIWMIGWCLILLAGIQRLPVPAIGVLALLIIAGHNLLDNGFWQFVESLDQRPLAWLWKILYVGFFAGPVTVGEHGPRLVVLYSIVPWIGVMAAGYAFGAVLEGEPRTRDRRCLQVGLGMIGLFVLLRAVNRYGDPSSWGAGEAEGSMPLWLAFLNTTKYPASLAFLLMTLGPAIALMPAANAARGAWVRWLDTFGRVPFFYYLLHIPLIHLLAVGVSWVRRGSVSPWLFANHPMSAPQAPTEDVWSLPLLYLVWTVAIVLLYLPCRWYAGVKARGLTKWLRYA